MKYAAKKIISMLVTLVIVSFLVFLAFAVIPGDPATSKLGTQATPERLQALREEMGLNRPFLERYGSWLVHAFQGDFGKSYSSIHHIVNRRCDWRETANHFMFDRDVLFVDACMLYSTWNLYGKA